jgi:hypothetical protein
VQIKVANISTFWWFSVLDVGLVFASTQQKNTCSSAQQYRPMERLTYQRHLLTAGPASDALRCRNTALGGKRRQVKYVACGYRYVRDELFLL